MGRRDNHTLDLFTDWEPPTEIVRAFDPQRVRGERFQSQLCHGIGEALKDCALSRGEVVETMRAFLGDDLSGNLSENVLNAWASEARTDQYPSAIRLLALIQATADIRLLQLMAEPMDWIVVDRKFLPAIQEAMISDQLEQNEKHRQLLEEQRRKARKAWKGES